MRKSSPAAECRSSTLSLFIIHCSYKLYFRSSRPSYTHSQNTFFLKPMRCHIWWKKDPGLLCRRRQQTGFCCHQIFFFNYKLSTLAEMQYISMLLLMKAFLDRQLKTQTKSLLLQSPFLPLKKNHVDFLLKFCMKSGDFMLSDSILITKSNNGGESLILILETTCPVVITVTFSWCAKLAQIHSKSFRKIC